MSENIDRIFSSIAGVYDVMGHVFSFGIDGIWRNMAAEEAMVEQDEYRILDVATGTGSIAIDIACKARRERKKVQITGVDYNRDMLKIAEGKVKKKKIENIMFKAEDAMDLEEPGCFYDVVTAGFLLRNVDDIEVFADELKRILKKNGKFILLEMGRPQNGIFGYIFKLYFYVIRLAGSLIDKSAYSWLTYSILAFDRGKMLNILKYKGFKDIKIKNLPFHIGFLVTGFKG